MSLLTTKRASSVNKGGMRLSKQLRENLAGYAMIFPAVLIIALFGLFPIGYSVYMSLFSWRARKGGFIGLKNYANVFGDWTGLVIFVIGILLLVLAYRLWNAVASSATTSEKLLKALAAGLLVAAGVLFAFGWDKMLSGGDQDFLKSLIITLFYALGATPLQLILGLFFAYILFQRIHGKEVFRVIFFLPYVTPIVSTAVVFRTIFSPRETSLANTLVGWFGVEPLRWLFEPRPLLGLLTGSESISAWVSPSLALVVIILFGVWTFFGYNTVIFLAGLGGISRDLYEAAEIDGANGWNTFYRITLPLLSPVTFYLFLISFIGTFRAFNHIYVMQTPNAQDTVVTAAVQVFNTFYVQNNYGYAATQAIVLFLIILGLTMAQNKLLGERVFYG